MDKEIWVTQHWGIGIGLVSAVAGLVLAAPENMNTWQLYERKYTESLPGIPLLSSPRKVTHRETFYLRPDELPPDGSKLIAVIPGNQEIKTLGVGLLLFGSSLTWAMAQALVPEYKRMEQLNWRIRRSEFELENVELEQNVEVQDFVIRISAEKEITRMLTAPKSYMGEEQESDEKEPELTRTATGFFAWLQEKAKKNGSNDFEVRWCCSQSFAGKKSSKFEVTSWVDELAQMGATEWLDEEKKTFRLIND